MRTSRRTASDGGSSCCKNLRAWFTRRECWAAEARFNVTHKYYSLWRNVKSLDANSVAPRASRPKTQIYQVWLGSHRSTLGHSLGRGLADAVGHHHSGLQVAADQAQNLPVPDLPAQLLHQPVVVDRVKEAFEVAIHRMAASFLPTGFHLAHRLMGVAAFAESITMLAEPSKSGPSTCAIACWITRSSTVGTPKGRCVPSGLGMNTLRTGAGRYVPSLIAARILGQCSRQNAGNASTVIPSMPGAPLFALTRFQAKARLKRGFPGRGFAP